MSLADTIDDAARRPLSLTVFSEEPVAVVDCFETGDVHVDHRPLPSTPWDGFVLVREGDEFVCAHPLAPFETLTAPSLAPPWADDDDRQSVAALLDVMEETPFDGYDRRQMLATSRVIEERAWRYGYGTLYAGFQSASALRSQEPIYARLAAETELSFELYLAEAVESVAIQNATLHEPDDDEFESYWFVLYDGSGDATNKYGLLAEERVSGSFSGLFTTDPAHVDAIISYLGDVHGT